jgi:hypothetical protein
VPEPRRRRRPPTAAGRPVGASPTAPRSRPRADGLPSDQHLLELIAVAPDRHRHESKRGRDPRHVPFRPAKVDEPLQPILAVAVHGVGELAELAKFRHADPQPRRVLGHRPATGRGIRGPSLEAACPDPVPAALPLDNPVEGLVVRGRSECGSLPGQGIPSGISWTARGPGGARRRLAREGGVGPSHAPFETLPVRPSELKTRIFLPMACRGAGRRSRPSGSVASSRPSRSLGPTLDPTTCRDSTRARRSSREAGAAA